MCQPSNVRISGFGSNACCAAPERLFTGTELSDRLSTKSLTMKLVSEKVSSVKIGALGNIDLPLGVGAVMVVNVARMRKKQTRRHSHKNFNHEPFKCSCFNA